MPVTQRERFEAVLNGQVPNHVPMSCRIDLWYNNQATNGTLPPEIADLTIEQIEDRLGWARSARFRDFVTEHREGVRETLEDCVGHVIRTWKVEGRKLQQVEQQTELQRRKGLPGRVIERFLKTKEDYQTMTRVWERTILVPDHAACQRFDRQTGSDGMPLLIFDHIPIHRIMQSYAGYGNCYFHLHDMPDAVQDLKQVMEYKYEVFWPELAKCAIPFIIHGAHWSSHMTPPPLFEQHFIPYLQKFTQAMHKAGKWCAFHGDNDLSMLLDLVVQSGVDAVECFACSPLVNLSLSKARQVWGDRIVIWGGCPSTMLDTSTSNQAFDNYLNYLTEEIADCRAFILGISDNAMPDALWSRIVKLAQRVSAVTEVG